MDDLEPNGAAGAAEPSIDDALNAGFDAAEAGEQPAGEGHAPSLEEVLSEQFDKLEQGEGEEQPEKAEAQPEGEQPAEAPEQYKQFHDEVNAALAPWEPVLAAQGLSKAQAVQNLVNLYSTSVRDPAGFLAGMAQQYAASVADPASRAALVQAFARGLGVDVGGGAQPMPDATNGAANPIEQRLASIEQSLQAHQAQQAQAVVTRVQSEIAEFAAAKDAQGSPAHPHFEAVKTTMGALIQAAAARGEKLSLEDAYGQAVWTKPELRETLTKAQAAQQARAAAEARRQGIAKARAAQTPRSASVPTPPEDISKMDLGAVLEKGWKELGLDAR